ncbi:hypothetical protein ES708_35079 [subsurface metagenome]
MVETANRKSPIKNAPDKTEDAPALGVEEFKPHRQPFALLERVAHHARARGTALPVVDRQLAAKE